MKSIRAQGGGFDKYDNVRLGLNGRLDTIQATILLEKLSLFPVEIELRNKKLQNIIQIISLTIYINHQYLKVLNLYGLNILCCLNQKNKEIL